MIATYIDGGIVAWLLSQVRNISETSEDSDPRKFEADELTGGGRTGACSRHLGDAAKRGEGPSEPDRALSPPVAK